MFRRILKALRKLAARSLRTRHMVQLNCALRGTEFDTGFRLACGTLLGWAREGRLLPWDPDVDFFVNHEDRERFLRDVLPELSGIGFTPKFAYRNNDGELTEVSFMRAGLRYDFFFTWTQGETETYFTYVHEHRPGQPVRMEQLTNRIPAQPVRSCEFMGVEWLVPVDADLELSTLYGQWRVRDKSFVYEKSHGLVSREAWHGSSPNLGDDAALALSSYIGERRSR